jgi:CubicO group peptidase (beta-lactamase class C family)
MRKRRTTTSAGARTRLAAVVQESIARGECPGAVVLVARRGKMLVHEAWGHAALEPKAAPMRTDTIFDLASLTKGMATAFLLMQLVDEGKLSLRDVAAEHLPEFRGHGKERIRIEELATHTSGLSDAPLYSPRAPMRNRSRDPWRAICACRPAAAPSARYEYQDANYIVLGKLIEAVAGAPLDQVFAQRVAEPLGLRDTCFCPDAAQLRRIAPTERLPEGLLRGVVHDPRARQLGGVCGNAGLFGTAHEVYRAVEVVLRGGLCGRKRLLSAAATERLCAVPKTATCHTRTIGWDTDPLGQGPRGDLFRGPGFGHTGFTGTSVWADITSQTVIVLLTSRLHPNGKGQVMGLRRRVANVVASLSITESSRPRVGSA